MIMRYVLGMMVALPLAGSPVAARQATPPAWSQDPSTRCRFVAPRSLPAGPTYWTGPCPGGKAAGYGMLRRRDGARIGPGFFGEMRGGVPQIGVIDLDGGYRVGKFADGDIGGARELEWAERSAAFEAAIRGARAVKAHYVARKNAASARHYEAVIKTLELQIE